MSEEQGTRRMQKSVMKTLWSLGVPGLVVVIMRLWPNVHWYVEACPHLAARSAPLIVVKNDSWKPIDDVKLTVRVQLKGGEVFVIGKDLTAPANTTVQVHGRAWKDIRKTTTVGDFAEIEATAKISAKSQVVLQIIGLEDGAGLARGEPPILFIGTQRVLPSTGPRTIPELPWVIAFALAAVIVATLYGLQGEQNRQLADENKELLEREQAQDAPGRLRTLTDDLTSERTAHPAASRKSDDPTTGAFTSDSPPTNN